MSSILVLPPWMAFMHRAWPRMKETFISVHRSASQYQLKMHSTAVFVVLSVKAHSKASSWGWLRYGDHTGPPVGALIVIIGMESTAGSHLRASAFCRRLDAMSARPARGLMPGGG